MPRGSAAWRRRRRFPARPARPPARIVAFGAACAAAAFPSDEGERASGRRGTAAGKGGVASSGGEVAAFLEGEQREGKRRAGKRAPPRKVPTLFHVPSAPASTSCRHSDLHQTRTRAQLSVTAAATVESATADGKGGGCGGGLLRRAAGATGLGDRKVARLFGAASRHLA
eukprot:356408-Chlamydomonas_euryale.AAC.2